MPYGFREIEKKWQAFWEEKKIFDVEVSCLDAREKFFLLDMFPYPSGDRLHMGHWFNYGLFDAWARYKFMMGKKVFVPMGFDAFGLPAENYAIKHGIHPDHSTSKNVEHMKEQFRRMGVTFNWKHALDTSKPEYYRWTQWLFLQLYKAGLAYKKEAPVNWCPKCVTVLANEQVWDGRCERCETEVTRKNLSQWFFKITDYADRLLKGLEKVDFPQRTRLMQENWIGRSEGVEIVFSLEDTSETFTVFTTRADTLFGVTYVVLAPEHPLVGRLVKREQREAVQAYVDASLKVTEVDRLSTARENAGAFTGAFAINPVNGERVPVWVGDYVLANYGSGAVMAVPAHDERDFSFAARHELPVRRVVVGENAAPDAPILEPFTGDGVLVSSGAYSGMGNREAMPLIIRDLEARGVARRKVNFRLRDWLVSRQRFWGSPIPIIHCTRCGEVPVPESDLPVRLPHDVDFRPTGESPLRRSAEFMNVPCPQCGAPAQREADTLDTFVCSSWYFLRFPSVGNDSAAFDKELTNRILPVDKYVGGPEHACMHLIYARFVTMALNDLGFLNFDEPFRSLTHHGIILGENGEKMSKSRGNSISPDPYVERYGSDVMRSFLAFAFNYTEGGPWSDDGIKAMARYVERVERLMQECRGLFFRMESERREMSTEDRKLRYALHHALKWVSIDMEKFQLNTCMARCMELTNAIAEYRRSVPEDAWNQAVLRDALERLALLLAPFMPHASEEWWRGMGHKDSVFREPWPRCDERFLVLAEIPMAVMIGGKLRGEMKVPSDAGEEEIVAAAKSQAFVAKHLEGKEVVRSIVVPRKLVNLILR